MAKKVLSLAEAKAIAAAVKEYVESLAKLSKLLEVNAEKTGHKKAHSLQLAGEKVLHAIEDKIYLDEQGKKHLLSEIL